MLKNFSSSLKTLRKQYLNLQSGMNIQPQFISFKLYKFCQNQLPFKQHITYPMSTSNTKTHLNSSSENIINNGKNKSFSIKNNAIQIMKTIETYIESPQFKKKFNSYYYLQKYSWICIHTWMLLYRFRQCEEIKQMISSYLLRKKILNLLQQYTRDQVYEYDQNFDRQIYQELKRIQQSIFWALDQYFIFKVDNKQFGQIIEQDLNLYPQKQTQKEVKQQNIEKQNLFEGLQPKNENEKYRWKKQQQMTEIGNYILTKMTEIINIPFQKIKNSQLKEWLKV